jgi:2-polyprenyl-6-methoxyphenol hydroxylase-like FAD-dependent oxidoreductase
VTLLGDAIHSTTPNLGQGACMALESAVVLADCVRRMGLKAEALRAYEEARRGRTAMVTDQSRSTGRMFQWQGGLLVWLRNRMMRSWYGRRMGRRLFEELMLYELPALDGAGAGG